MEKYAGRLLADRYRLPQAPSDEFEFVESRAFDTASGQEVLVRQVPLPEVVDAELVDGDARRGGAAAAGARGGFADRATRTPDDPLVRRALEAAVAAAALPDHPRLDQVFDVFVQGDGLWIVSEAVPARPLAALLAEEGIGPYRAAEVAADLLAALRIVHANGWTHRNVTARTVLICDDGRAVLTGLAAGAAEEVLCGYDPLPAPEIPDTFAARPRSRGPAGAPPGPAAGNGGLAGGSSPAGGYDSGNGNGNGGNGNGGGAGQGNGGARPTGSAGTPLAADGASAAGSWLSAGAPAEPVGPGAWDAPPGPAAEPAAGGYQVSAGYGAAPPAGAGYWGSAERQWPPGVEPAGAPRPGEAPGAVPSAEDTPGDLPPGFASGAPQGELPDGYQRWDSGPGAPPAAGTPGERDGLPSSWDFEGGARQPGGFGGPESTGEHRPPETPAERAAAERAARSGAIAAYRAGARAGAARSAHHPGRPQDGGGGEAADGGRGAGAPEPPGPRLPSEPVRAGWELPGAPRPGGPEPTGEWSVERADDRPRARPSERAGQLSAVPPAGPAADRRGPAGPGLPAQRPGEAPVPTPQVVPTPQGGPSALAGAPAATGAGEAADDRYRGPDSALAAERARQARIMVVGAVTERWAPEQAGPVYEHWRLAPPVGPAVDFWALGALLFRAVQGYPAYPEDSAAELVQAVCAEQPAFAEDCGALRPIVESLLRQDPTERPSAEALRGWLRSLLRGAPEPDVGRHLVTAPPPALEPGRPADPRRLPILRRRGELVGPRRRPRERGEHRPRRLGRVLLTLVLLGLAGAVAYVLAFAPGERGAGGATGEGRGPDGDSTPDEGVDPAPPGAPGGGEDEEAPEDEASAEPTEGATQPSPAEGDSEPAPPPDGFVVVSDAAGFALAVPADWRRETAEAGGISYGDGELEILVVPGRDSVADFGDTPMNYQLTSQPELAAFREYQFAQQSGLLETRVGDVQMAEGVFAWREGGRDLVAYNRVLLIAGDYHVVQVRGPSDLRDRVAETYDVTAESYQRAD
ncbi:hypothetical protein RM844_16135 [Streptomyces sp. DSM 44915]|uniref:Protein kinase domain-containing protein n=1 Tax=Streptomyces chisholmiae TaxID=3075540 RepID=A0ABU2JTI8_9ACTN|nr:hypothetical protein [Streptomyces sp. DSM 44915]MDT0267814.1 hypothetical protein [Streptomyces sp. DSM 44915]